MIGVTNYLVIVAVLCKGFTLAEGALIDLSKSPLVQPTEILLKNFDRTCQHKDRSDKFKVLLKNIEIAFFSITVGDCFLIATGDVSSIKDKLLALFFEATDKTYSLLENAIYKQYFTNSVNLGIGEVLVYVYGADNKDYGLLIGAMKDSCSVTDKENTVCKYHMELITCFEDSLAFQNVFENALNVKFPKFFGADGSKR